MLLTLVLAGLQQGKPVDLIELGRSRATFGMPRHCPDRCQFHGSLDLMGFEHIMFPTGVSNVRYSISATESDDIRLFLSRQVKLAGKAPKIDWIIPLGDLDARKTTPGTLRDLIGGTGYSPTGKIPKRAVAELEAPGGFAIYTRQFSGKPYWFFPHSYPDPDKILGFDNQDGTWPLSKTPYPICAEEAEAIKKGLANRRKQR